MASVVARPSTSTVLGPPDLASQAPSQKSPVYEYSCLFTHDVRRKNTKRWQDGFLRFHVFNKRAMVFDQSRNYIGDTHFQDAGAEGPNDGDEMYLDRNGVLIQVGAKLSVHETDLSHLLAKRQPKEVPQEILPVQQISPHSSSQRPNQRQLQSRSVNVAPFTPVQRTGWLGRAQLPKQSPFEVKRSEEAAAAENEWEAGPPSKRQRRDDEHIPLWQILKTSRPPKANAPVAPKESTKPNQDKEGQGKKTVENFKKKARQSNTKEWEIVDLVSNDPYEHTPERNPSPALEWHQNGETEHSSLNSPLYRSRQPSKPRAPGKKTARESNDGQLNSPPVNTTSDFVEAPAQDNAAGTASSSEQHDIPQAKYREENSASKLKTKPLRLANSAPRKMLLCHTMGLTSKSSRTSKDDHHDVSLIEEQGEKLAKKYSKTRTEKDSHRDSAIEALRTEVAEETNFVSDFDLALVSTPNETEKGQKRSVQGEIHFEDEESPFWQLHDLEENIPTPVGAISDNVKALETNRGDSAPSNGLLPLANCAAAKSRNGIVAVHPKQVANNASAGATAATMDANTAKPSNISHTTAPQPESEQQRRNPSLRRHCSDTSPIKKPAGHALLARAETIGSRPTDKQRQLPPRGRKGELEPAHRNTDCGPWSREAWDLFGWCPPARQETLHWAYGDANGNGGHVTA